ncbi:MAG: hypothetical protein JO033_07655 [Acidobacteriaceae bacterium]|nr:hypothetical protein [Acidobacteriaceae bacterium]
MPGYALTLSPEEGTLGVSGGLSAIRKLDGFAVNLTRNALVVEVVRLFENCVLLVGHPENVNDAGGRRAQISVHASRTNPRQAGGWLTHVIGLGGPKAHLEQQD